MSALGQKQTFAVQKVMSALPPKSGHSSLRLECAVRKRTLGLFDEDKFSN